MKTKEVEISIDDFDNKKMGEGLISERSAKKAVVTHYLQNSKLKSSTKFKKGANQFVKELVQYKRDEEGFDIVSEIALQKLLFEMENVPFPSPKKSKFKFIDLFAGIGGFRLALQGLGGKCVFTSEWDEQAKKTYKANFGEVPFGDITKEETKSFIPDDFDVLCAGFPCQAFSIAGNRKGFADTRGTLFFDVEAIIEKHRPKVVFLENVKNLVTHDGGNTFEVIINSLEKKLNYVVYYKVLNSMTHGDIPQNRERIFIVAFDPSQVKNHGGFEFPKPVPLDNSLNNVIDRSIKVDDKYYYKKDQRYYPKLVKEIISKDTVYQWRRVYVRENKSGVCPTLTANMGTGGHNVPLILDDYGIRKLTPRECFLLQGYPSNYILPNISNSKLYMQVGNSVTTSLIRRISQNIVTLL